MSGKIENCIYQRVWNTSRYLSRTNQGGTANYLDIRGEFGPETFPLLTQKRIEFFFWNRSRIFPQLTFTDAMLVSRSQILTLLLPFFTRQHSAAIFSFSRIFLISPSNFCSVFTKFHPTLRVLIWFYHYFFRLFLLLRVE